MWVDVIAMTKNAGGKKKTHGEICGMVDSSSPKKEEWNGQFFFFFFSP